MLLCEKSVRIGSCGCCEIPYLFPPTLGANKYLRISNTCVRLYVRAHLERARNGSPDPRVICVIPILYVCVIDVGRNDARISVPSDAVMVMMTFMRSNPICTNSTKHNRNACSPHTNANLNQTFE